MTILVGSYLFIAGLIFGSFVLAMVDRMKSGKDWVRGRSECDKCKNKLQPIDLIPLFSWLSMGGKCRYCKVKLTRIYPLTELTVGFAFLISYIFWPYELTGINSILAFAIWLCAVVLMSGLFLFDVRWFLLPNKLVRPLIALGLVWATLDIFKQGLSSSILIDYGLAIAVSAGLFLLMFVISKGAWIGDGDIRLGVAIGLFVGGPLEAWLVIFLASVLGVVFSLPLVFKSKKSKRLKLKIPFGPMLIIALYITVLFGTEIIDWYKATILYL